MYPRVSVIMAVYNGEKYLREAVDSILAQTLTDFELIIVDDASIDGTRATLESYSDPRIRVLYNPSNIGQAVSRNAALAVARAKYIAVMDADDIALPVRLQRQAEWLDRHPGVGLLGTYVVAIDEMGRELRCERFPTSDADLKWALLFHNSFVHSSVMMRKSILDEAGGYSKEACMRFVEDYELLSRANRCARAAILPDFLVKYRVHPQGESIRCAAEQSRRTEEVARRNVAWLLGSAVPDVGWAGLMRLAVNWAPLSAEEVNEALALKRRINEAFEGHILDAASARQHRRRDSLFWARRAFAQARRNPHLDRRCRALMLRTTAEFLADASLRSFLGARRKFGEC